MIDPPKKPFDEFKWKWATWQPTEGLNNPTLYLGVLRALKKFEGKPASDPEFAQHLEIVFSDMAHIHLGRTPSRNIIRNSGQYWKATGLYNSNRNRISLTEFGHKVADGAITPEEFASTVIKSFTLPNANTLRPREFKKWNDHNIRISPLQLILRVVSEIPRDNQGDQHISTEELIKIIVPLSARVRPIREFTEAIINYRTGCLQIESWPNCAPNSNDKRVAREFLLFLSHYGFLNAEESRGSNWSQKFYASKVPRTEVVEFIDAPAESLDLIEVYRSIRNNEIISEVARQRVATTTIQRSGQTRFRKDVLEAFGTMCLITRDNMPSVLQAAHIIPVKDNGTDSLNNGLCLRADIHTLFDASHLRVSPDGTIKLSDTARSSRSYNLLPQRIDIPAFVSPKAISWRWNYN